MGVGSAEEAVSSKVGEGRTVSVGKGRSKEAVGVDVSAGGSSMGVPAWSNTAVPAIESDLAPASCLSTKIKPTNKINARPAKMNEKVSRFLVFISYPMIIDKADSLQITKLPCLNCTPKVGHHQRKEVQFL